MYDAILIPTDGSEGVTRTLEHGLEMARNHDATVHVLFVVDRRLYRAASDGDQDEVLASLHEDGEAAVEAVADRARSEGLDVVTSIREGIPYRDIVAYVEEHDIDAIVMGTHGRTGRDRLAHLGSVTERVVDNTPVPVLVVNIAN